MVLFAVFAELFFEEAVPALVDRLLGGGQEVFACGSLVLELLLGLLLSLLFEGLGALGDRVKVATRRESLLVGLLEGLLVPLVSLGFDESLGIGWREHVAVAHTSHCPVAGSGFRLLLSASTLVWASVAAAASLAGGLRRLVVDPLLLVIRSSWASASLPGAEI